MKKIIATFVMALILAVGVISASAQTMTTTRTIRTVVHKPIQHRVIHKKVVVRRKVIKHRPRHKVVRIIRRVTRRTHK